MNLIPTSSLPLSGLEVSLLIRCGAPGARGCALRSRSISFLCERKQPHLAKTTAFSEKISKAEIPGIIVKSVHIP